MNKQRKQIKELIKRISIFLDSRKKSLSFEEWLHLEALCYDLFLNRNPNSNHVDDINEIIKQFGNFQKLFEFPEDYLSGEPFVLVDQSYTEAARILKYIKNIYQKMYNSSFDIEVEWDNQKRSLGFNDGLFDKIMTYFGLAIVLSMIATTIYALAIVPIQHKFAEEYVICEVFERGSGIIATIKYEHNGGKLKSVSIFEKVSGVIHNVEGDDFYEVRDWWNQAGETVNQKTRAMNQLNDFECRAEDTKWGR